MKHANMSRWVENPKQNPPPEGVMVWVTGDDYLGAWEGVAMRKDYKRPPGKGWRWVTETGENFCDQAIIAWRHID